MPCIKLEVLLVCALCIHSVVSKYTPFLDPGFFFDYNKPGQPVPIPVTEQCERIHITWGRNTARGANPVAPYFMQVYTSTFITPFVIPVGSGLTFDWDVPFFPGTQYQICMFDINGLTGGCQAMYTVIQNSTTLNPTCQNVTAPAELSVVATVPGGPMSQYGFIEQCTDITIAPRSGKPPFTLTVAPSLHPPYNITSNSMDSIAWTVSLSWSFPFFIALSSSDGQMWSNGPLHAGGFGSNDCLAPGTIPKKTASKMALGAGLGSAFGGLILGGLSAYFYSRSRRRRRPTSSVLEKEAMPPGYLADGEGLRPLPPLPSFPSETVPVAGQRSFFNRPGSEITVVPFTASPSTYNRESLKGRTESSRDSSTMTRNSTWPGPASRPRIVTQPTYIIHEDAERLSTAPSYPRTPDSDSVVELPPRYMKNPARSGSI